SSAGIISSPPVRLSLPRYQVEPDQYPVLVGHIADDPAKGKGKLPDQGRGSKHKVVRDHCVVLVDVNDFEVKPPLEMLIADLSHVIDGYLGPGGISCDVETQHIPRRTLL